MVNLLIRADAGLQTGAGHVMRCLALAHACRAQGGEAVFLSHCESQALCQRIRELGFELVSLEAPHPAPTDLRTTLSLLAQLTADQWRSTPTFVVLDGYHFDSAYQQAIQDEGRRLLVIDDTGHLPHYAADVLLNHGLLAAQTPYLLNVTTIPLLGSRYALLRPEFLAWRDWQREIPTVARRVLVTLGGSDPHNVTRKVMLALARLAEPDLEVRDVIGPANLWLSGVAAGSARYSRSRAATLRCPRYASPHGVGRCCDCSRGRDLLGTRVHGRTTAGARAR
jgi:UDP-2,4-diacetamido-2,4,6-trideoxy-beta-L-altropyranose hydrolase